MFPPEATLIAAKIAASSNKGSSYRYLSQIDKDILTSATPFLLNTAVPQQRVWHIANDINTLKLCSMCSKPLKWIISAGGYRATCSNKCSKNSPEYFEARKKTFQANYGVDHPSQSPEIKEAKKQTSIKHYGVDHPRKNAEVEAQRIDTNIAKYGFANPRKSDSVKQKIQNTIQQRYARNTFSQQVISLESLEKLNNIEWLTHQHHTLRLSMIDIAAVLDVSDVTVGNYLRIHNIEIKYGVTQSAGERELYEFLVSLGIINIQRKNRTIISPKELDIILPDYNLAIEYCGLYWHSDRFKHKNYHAEKLQHCVDKHLKLITLFEDDWMHRQEIVKSMLMHQLNLSPSKINARSCEIEELTTKQKNDFLDKYHIQGAGKSTISYGLQCNNELVAVMSFCKKPNGVFELTRYATSTRVVGGMSKLLSHFKKNNIWAQIITYADRCWSDGNAYIKTGFHLHRTQNPSYYYVVNGQRKHRSLFMKKYLAKKLESYDPTKTEFSNMDAANILRIWDCGKLTYSMNFHK